LIKFYFYMRTLNFAVNVFIVLLDLNIKINEVKAIFNTFKLSKDSANILHEFTNF
jgi:hypothetical protein